MYRFPPGVCSKARALRKDLGAHADLSGSAEALEAEVACPWRMQFYGQWTTFVEVLETLGKATLHPAGKRSPKRRVLDAEAHVLRTLKAEGLLTLHQRVADILAEFKAHVSQKPVPEQPATRVRALRDAIERLKTSN